MDFITLQYYQACKLLPRRIDEPAQLDCYVPTVVLQGTTDDPIDTTTPYTVTFTFVARADQTRTFPHAGPSALEYVVAPQVRGVPVADVVVSWPFPAGSISEKEFKQLCEDQAEYLRAQLFVMGDEYSVGWFELKTRRIVHFDPVSGAKLDKPCEDSISDTVTEAVRHIVPTKVFERLIRYGIPSEPYEYSIVNP